MNTAAIVLAAGSSSRLGQPKQLVVHCGESLVRRAIRAAREVNSNPIVVVLGAQADQLRTTLEGLEITRIRNGDWQEGIASSIRAGVGYLVDNAPGIDSAFLLACDQPFVDDVALQHLLDLRLTSGKPIVASFYEGTYGIPALFDRSCFADLLKLKGDYGAKRLILSHPAQVAAIEFPNAAIDIDTPADFQKL